MKLKITLYLIYVWLLSVASGCAQTNLSNQNADVPGTPEKKDTAVTEPQQATLTLDTVEYKNLQEYLSNGDAGYRWPVKDSLPVAGAVLPYKRIIAYYGNLYVKGMGILGELPKDSMIKKLQDEVKKWCAADSVIKSIPALHYIAVTAQAQPGAAKTYRLRMPFHQIDTVIKWAREINALVFIDIQVGQSTVAKELPEFEKYLAMPDVHLGLDPEFSMKGGEKPGSVIGAFDAEDINYATDYLSQIAKKYNTPPKIFILHRFTQGMVKNYKKIKLHREVQVVVSMDGWGLPAKKAYTYKQFIYPEPVQFAGFKIFYKNDTKRVGQLKEMQPEDVLKLKPKPIYIQYQ